MGFELARVRENGGNKSAGIYGPCKVSAGVCGGFGDL
jgi:hypothetical protein